MSFLILIISGWPFHSFFLGGGVFFQVTNFFSSELHNKNFVIQRQSLFSVCKIANNFCMDWGFLNMQANSGAYTFFHPQWQQIGLILFSIICNEFFPLNCFSQKNIAPHPQPMAMWNGPPLRTCMGRYYVWRGQSLPCIKGIFGVHIPFLHLGWLALGLGKTVCQGGAF